MASNEIDVTEESIIEFEHEDHFDSVGLGAIEQAIADAQEATADAAAATADSIAQTAEAKAAAEDAEAAAELARSAVSQDLRFWLTVYNGHLAIADAGEQPVEEEEE